ncbi:MAG: anthraniloyl-CoA monooxygenase [Actinomycetota bacterium]|nr:anthraniloyl-CoA monooxygenase [Actinomycetota bacterium]
MGAGPAGLYFSLLLRKARPESDVKVIERNPAGATYGWGVVFSDRTLTSFREADYKTYAQITDDFIIWDAIDVRYRDSVIRCEGQVFSGIARRSLLGLLHARCEELGVKIEHDRAITHPDELNDYDLVVGADGVNSVIREANADSFKPRFSPGTSRYIWFGTRRVFDSFTFAFRENAHGFFQAHAYPFDGQMSTFIPECDEQTWRNSGLDTADEATSIAYCEELFESDLRGHSLMSNNSRWINFETLRCKTWHHERIVLVGDAAHTAHFSIGSGTKLAMEDSIALVNALETKPDIESALIEYELERKPRVERFQEAARQSQDYFENTRVYRHMEPPQFAFHLLSRSGRIDYDDLRVRDPDFVSEVDRWFIATARPEKAGLALATPPAFAPFRLGDLELSNRVAVVAAPTYSSIDGVPPADALSGPARSGAGLAFTDIVAVSAHGRVTPDDSGLYDETHAEGWLAEITELRAHSDAAVGVTLSHSGPRGSTRPRDRAADIALEEAMAWTPIAASPQTYSPRSLPAAEIDGSRLSDVKDDFVRAAVLAGSAGFDLVELHMAHGYLLGSFLSPLTNARSDEYGSDPMRYPLEVLDAVRVEWNDKPLGIVMNASDWARGGISLDDAVAMVTRFKEHGCDVIRVVAGQTTSRYSPRYDPYFLTHYAERIRNRAGIATIATGDIRNVDRVNTIVAGGRADLCVLATA